MRGGMKGFAAIASARDPGWTFVETIVVIMIIVALTGIVGFVAFRYVDAARKAAARSQIEIFRLSLDAYYLDNGAYPSAEQGLEALWEKPILAPLPEFWNGPYLERKAPRDPWGREYRYLAPGDAGLPWSISCLGADGREGGDGADEDILSWKSE